MKRHRMKRIIDELLADSQENTAGRVDDFQRLCREYLRGHWKALLFVFLSLAPWAAVPYGFAATHRYLIDNVLGPAYRGETVSDERMQILTLGVLIIFGLNMLLHTVNLVCNWISNYFTLRIGQEMAMRLRKEIFLKLEKLHLDYYDRNQSGRIIARIQADVGRIQRIMTSHISHLLIDPVKLVAGMAILFWMSPRLAVIMAVSAPLYAVIFAWLRPHFRRNRIAHSRITSRLYGLCAERISAIQVVQTFGRERSEVGRFGRGVHDGVRLAQRQALYQQGLSFTSASIHACTAATVLWVGLNAVRTGSHGLTLGAVVAFIQLTQQVFQPIQNLTRMAGIMQAGFVALRRVFALLDEPRQVKPGSIRLTGMSGRITFNDVTFRYPTQTEPALRNVCFKIKPGEHVAIMGPSGSGKTTLFNLILRFYEPQEGRVSVGGVNVSDADTSSLRRHVRFVQQEPFLFSGSLAENIAYGTPEATEEDIIEVTKLAEMHEFIMTLPNKYDSLVAEQGAGLSGGQKQRLALAAALLTRPEILLMDDTTSALDARTEARIRDTLIRVQQGRTSLIITQRITTARTCDRIIVLEDGRITQTGTHAELSNAEGFYRRIFQQQDSMD